MTLTYGETNSNEPSPERNRNVLLRALDALAEWLMRQELRVINRSRPLGTSRMKTCDDCA